MPHQTGCERVRAQISAAQKGNWKNAIASYTKAIQRDPSNYEYHLDRARAYEQIGDNKKAILDYRKVLEVPATTARARGWHEVARERLAGLGLTDEEKSESIPPHGQTNLG